VLLARVILPYLLQRNTWSRLSTSSFHLMSRRQLLNIIVWECQRITCITKVNQPESNTLNITTRTTRPTGVPDIMSCLNTRQHALKDDHRSSSSGVCHTKVCVDTWQHLSKTSETTHEVLTVVVVKRFHYTRLAPRSHHKNELNHFTLERLYFMAPNTITDWIHFLCEHGMV